MNTFVCIAFYLKISVQILRLQVGVEGSSDYGHIVCCNCWICLYSFLRWLIIPRSSTVMLATDILFNLIDMKWKLVNRHFYSASWYRWKLVYYKNDLQKLLLLLTHDHLDTDVFVLVPIALFVLSHSLHFWYCSCFLQFLKYNIVYDFVITSQLYFK